MKSIGKGALSSLKLVEIEEGCRVNVKNMIGKDAKLQIVRAARIPEGTRTVTEGQFRDQSICRVTVPKSVEEIQKDAFSGCRRLKEVTFAEGCALKRLGECAFKDCSKVKNIQLPDRLEDIGPQCFSNTLIE